MSEQRSKRKRKGAGLLDNLNLDPSHLERYFEYKNQVDCELYHDVNMFNLEQEAIEENWPLQKDSANLLLQAKCCDLPPEHARNVPQCEVQ